MTVLGSLNVRCRHCGANSEQTVMVSTSTFGAPDLDLRPAEMKRSSMAAWLQLCPHCGYCVPHISEGVPEGSVLTSDSYRATLRDERYPELARRFLAHALATAHSEPVRSAWAYLHAAWVCDDAGSSSLAIEARRIAADLFRRLPPSSDPEQQCAVDAVLVDVLRRSGQLDEADAKCRLLLAHRQCTGPVRRVIEYQQRLIAAGDRSAHRVADDESA